MQKTGPGADARFSPRIAQERRENRHGCAQFGPGARFLFAGAPLRAIDFPAAPGLSSATTQHSPTSDVWEVGILAATACDICAPERFRYDDLTEIMTVFSSRSRNV